MGSLSSLIATPTYTAIIPSTKQEIKFRPFLVKEEKALLTAQQSEDLSVLSNTLKSVIDACTFGEIDLDSLATFDVEYLFIQIRAKSVGEIVSLIFSCDQCNDPKAQVKVDIDVSTVKVEETPGHSNKINLFGSVGVIMKYPSISTLGKLNAAEEDENVMFEIVSECLESVYNNEEIFKISEQPKEEVNEFLENLTKAQFEKIEEFFETMPQLYIDFEFTCPVCGFHHKQRAEGLQSFF